MGLKVVVTGASSGIGRATARRFAKDGHDVYITARSEDKLNETFRLAKETGDGEVYQGVGDVQVEAHVLRNYQEAIKALGQIDVLVLGAGVGWARPLEEYIVAEYETFFNTNVRGHFFWLKAAIPAFKKQGFGQIVIVNSISAFSVHSPGWSVYASTQFALKGMAEGLRMDVKGTGIKVASVHPGTCDTNIWSHQLEKTGKDFRKEINFDLALLPKDVADTIATIAYQDPRSDIDMLRVLPNYAPKRHGVSLN